MVVACARTVGFGVPTGNLEAGKSQRAPCTDFGEISGFNFDIVGDIASGCRAYAGRDVRVVVDGER